MHPALSILFFTTLAGSAQGLVVALAMARLLGVVMAPGFLLQSLAIAELLLLTGLGASFLHLGRKTRAWRAVLMWRTSWMSREVIILPAFIALVAGWWFAECSAVGGPWYTLLPILGVAGALALWYCTAMIYACLRFIEEWAHPLTIVNYTLIGLSSGLLLACALGVLAGEAALVQAATPWALLLTLLAWATRTLALRRNAGLRHKSTLQSATGIQAPKLVQTSMGMSAGSFNTREFFHGAKLATVKNIRLGFIWLAFAGPVLMLTLALATHSGLPLLLAVLAQAPGLIAERWFFFAEAKHPQNLYYQVVG